MPAFGGVNFSNTQVGWTAGGGAEWMFMPNSSTRVEYLYYNLGAITQDFVIAAHDPRPPPGAAFFGGLVRGSITGNIVRAGVNCSSYYLI